MRIGIIQMDLQPLAVKATMREIVAAIDKNVGVVAETVAKCRDMLWITPELALTGPVNEDHPMSEIAGAISRDVLPKLADVCRTSDSRLVVGGVDWDSTARRARNAAYYVTAGGGRPCWHKLHMVADADSGFAAGRLSPEVIASDDIKLGVLICKDAAFEEPIRTLLAQGADIIVHPGNLTDPWYVDRTRYLARRFGVWVVTASAVGRSLETRPRAFVGGSQLVGPSGRPIGRVGTSVGSDVLQPSEDFASLGEVRRWRSQSRPLAAVGASTFQEDTVSFLRSHPDIVRLVEPRPDARIEIQLTQIRGASVELQLSGGKVVLDGPESLRATSGDVDGGRAPWRTTATGEVEWPSVDPGREPFAEKFAASLLDVLRGIDVASPPTQGNSTRNPGVFC